MTLLLVYINNVSISLQKSLLSMYRKVAREIFYETRKFERARNGQQISKTRGVRKFKGWTKMCGMA